MWLWICYCLLGINLIAFCLMGYDKYCAIKHKRRIAEKTLLTLMLCFGSVGIFSGIYVFSHKKKKIYFTLGSIFAILIQLYVLFSLQSMY